MSYFSTAVKIIESRLSEVTGTEFSKSLKTHHHYFGCALTYTYAMVCPVNKTYFIGVTKDLKGLEERFNLWNNKGDMSKLPKKFRDVLEEPSSRQRLFVVFDDNKANYKRLHQHLAEEHSYS